MIPPSHLWYILFTCNLLGRVVEDLVRFLEHWINFIRNWHLDQWFQQPTGTNLCVHAGAYFMQCSCNTCSAQLKYILIRQKKCIESVVSKCSKAFFFFFVLSYSFVTPFYLKLFQSFTLGYLELFLWCISWLLFHSIGFMENLLLRQQWRMAAIIWILVENQRSGLACLVYYFTLSIFSMINHYCSHFCELVWHYSYSWVTVAGHIISQSLSHIHAIHSIRVGSRDVAVMRVLASDQFGQVWFRPGAICGLSNLLLVPPWLGDFSLGSPIFPTSQNQIEHFKISYRTG